MSERYQLVELARQEGANLSALARRFGVSRKTLYKWVARFQAAGKPALADQSRRPLSSPARCSPEIEAAVIALRRLHPAWGARKLLRRLQDLGHSDLPSISTATAMLHRHGLIEPEASRARQALRRFESGAPNDLWQMDFKGHFVLSRGGSCHPLTVLDDHSRYCLTLAACGDETTETTQGHLHKTFQIHGLPRRMLCDNGAPWGVSGRGPGLRWTRLSVWLLRLGIQVIHGRPYHPQTQGKDERFHRSMVEEVLKWQQFWDLAHAASVLEPWREVYNHQRPHEGIGMEVPARRYCISPRAMPEKLPEIVYEAGVEVRRVNKDGAIKFKGQKYMVGNPFTGLDVALRETGTDGLWDVQFCQQKLGQLDERAGIIQGRYCGNQSDETLALDVETQ